MKAFLMLMTILSITSLVSAVIGGEHVKHETKYNFQIPAKINESQTPNEQISNDKVIIPEIPIFEASNQNSRQSRQNGIFIQSTIDDKEYIIFQPESLDSVLKLMGQKDVDDVTKNIDDKQNQDNINNDKEVKMVKTPLAKGDGLEVPLVPENYFTSEGGPTDQFENEGDDEEESHIQENHNNEVVTLLRRLERLERQWIKRYALLKQRELELKRERNEFIMREKMFLRREAMRRQAEYEADLILAYRRNRRRNNLNKSRIQKLVGTRL